MASGLYIAGFIVLVIGLLMLIIGLIFLVINRTQPKPWYSWTLVLVGLFFTVIGGVMALYEAWKEENAAGKFVNPNTGVMVTANSCDTTSGAGNSGLVVPACAVSA